MALSLSVRGCVRALLLCCIAVMFAGGSPRMATAAESGTGIYLLGFRSSLAGFVPPPGTYFQSDKFFYSGEAQGGRSATANTANFEIAGQLVAGVEVDVFLDVLTGMWVSQSKLFGGNLGLTASLPVGWMDVAANVGVGIAGPRNTFAATASDSDDLTSVGDLFLMAMLGWHSNYWHWNVNAGVNAPTGDYKVGRLANLGFNRWAVDLGIAATWLDQKTGREFSFAPAVTFNVENPDTNYKTGTEFHVEFAATQNLTKKFAIGINGYHYQQLTGDSGSGALLGDFKGRVTALGPVIRTDFSFRGIPVSLNARWYHEFNVKRKLEGDSGFITVAIPLGTGRQ